MSSSYGQTETIQAYMLLSECDNKVMKQLYLWVSSSVTVTHGSLLQYIDYTQEDWLDRLLYALPLRGMQQLNDDVMMSDLDVRDDDDVPFYQDIYWL